MVNFFKKEQKIIANPDEVIISCINGDVSLISRIVETDAFLIVKILDQFDINSVSRILAQLPDKKVKEVYFLFNSKKQEQILKRLPSIKAASLVRETIKA
ncbi:MAG: hypothetical protein PHF25_05250 [Candidatus Margulisbacteria bacterium]|nr:hypothetical protein [Candidatus Margulisiibacteriota bacterium]